MRRSWEAWNWAGAKRGGRHKIGRSGGYRRRPVLRQELKGKEEEDNIGSLPTASHISLIVRMLFCDIGCINCIAFYLALLHNCCLATHVIILLKKHFIWLIWPRFLLAFCDADPLDNIFALCESLETPNTKVWRGKSFKDVYHQVT